MEMFQLPFKYQPREPLRAPLLQVILLGHIPFGGEDTVAPFALFIESLCTRFSDVIVVHLLGHQHKDEFRLVSQSDLLYNDYDLFE